MTRVITSIHWRVTLPYPAALAKQNYCLSQWYCYKTVFFFKSRKREAHFSSWFIILFLHARLFAFCISRFPPSYRDLSDTESQTCLCFPVRGLCLSDSLQTEEERALRASVCVCDTQRPPRWHAGSYPFGPASDILSSKEINKMKEKNPTEVCLCMCVSVCVIATWTTFSIFEEDESHVSAVPPVSARTKHFSSTDMIADVSWSFV